MDRRAKHDLKVVVGVATAYLAVIVLVCALVALTGCATPQQRFVSASAAYVAAVNTAMAFQDQGLLTPERQRQIAVAEQLAYTALTTWGEALESSKPAEVYVRAFYDALEALTLKLMEVQDAERSGVSEGAGDINQPGGPGS